VITDAESEINEVKYRAKQGKGVFGHLMALNRALFMDIRPPLAKLHGKSVNFPKGAGILERALSVTDPVMKKTLLDATVASNGGGERYEGVADFSTVSGSGESNAYGYMFRPDGSLRMNVRTDAKYKDQTSLFYGNFLIVYRYIAALLQPQISVTV
jgi:hypothetical protein